MKIVSPRLALALAASLAAALAPVSAARAEEGSTLRVRVGLGAEWAPRFPGANDNRIGPMVDVSIAGDDQPFAFEAPDDSFDIRLVSAGSISAGVVGNLQSSRKNSDVGAEVGKVPTTFEIGGFAQARLMENVRLRVEARRGVGGHDGMIARFGADYLWRNGDRYLVSIGPRVTIGNGAYQHAYYGVSPTAAAATGLPVYRPDGGLQSVGAIAGVHAAVSSRWGIFGYTAYERLVGDVRRSPLIERFGSSNAFAGGLGLTYIFSVRR